MKDIRNITTKQACNIYAKFGGGDGNRRVPKTDDVAFCRAAHGYLDAETHDHCVLFLKASWLSAHKVGNLSFSGLLDVCADCVKHAIRRGLAISVTPVDIAADGTMTVTTESDGILIKVGDDAIDWNNWGSNRLGVSVNRQPDARGNVGWKVCVGPFFQLKGSAEAAVKKAKAGLAHP